MTPVRISDIDQPNIYLVILKSFFLEGDRTTIGILKGWIKVKSMYWWSRILEFLDIVHLNKYTLSKGHLKFKSPYVDPINIYQKGERKIFSFEFNYFSFLLIVKAPLEILGYFFIIHTVRLYKLKIKINITFKSVFYKNIFPFLILYFCLLV